MQRRANWTCCQIASGNFGAHFGNSHVEGKDFIGLGTIIRPDLCARTLAGDRLTSVGPMSYRFLQWMLSIGIGELRMGRGLTDISRKPAEHLPIYPRLGQPLTEHLMLPGQPCHIREASSVHENTGDGCLRMNVLAFPDITCSNLANGWGKNQIRLNWYSVIFGNEMNDIEFYTLSNPLTTPLVHYIVLRAHHDPCLWLW